MDMNLEYHARIDHAASGAAAPGSRSQFLALFTAGTLFHLRTPYQEAPLYMASIIKSHARFGQSKAPYLSRIHEKASGPRHLVRVEARVLACVKPRLTWLMHYRDQVVRRVRSSDERVNTLQE